MNTRALTIINAARDNIARLENFEVCARDYFQPDAMKEWQRLRERSREPEPEPTPRPRDVRQQRAAADWEASWEFWKDVGGQVIAEERHRMRRHVKKEISALEISGLRRELRQAHAEIKKLKSAKRDKADDGRIVGWRIDRQGYVATPVSANGKLMASFNVRELFAQYFSETSDG